jgi:hypothetical protein
MPNSENGEMGEDWKRGAIFRAFIRKNRATPLVLLQNLRRGCRGISFTIRDIRTQTFDGFI